MKLRRLWSIARLRLRSLLRRRQVERELDKELHFSDSRYPKFRFNPFDFRDELPGKHGQVILSDRLWRARFSTAPDVIGRKITLDSQPFVIVGVMPPGVFHPGNDRNRIAHGDTVDLWWPLTFEGNPANRGQHYLDGVGRLKRGVTLQQAQAEMQSLANQLRREHPNFAAGWKVHVVSLHKDIVGASERMLLALFGAVGFVLLIACVNAANLLLARAISRQREMAVRSALGAGRSRLVRQMLTESVLIALLGGAAGGLLALSGTRILVSLLPADFPRAEAIHVDLIVFTFTFLVALATGVLFGLAPALQAFGADVNSALHSSSRSSTGSARHFRLRDFLVVAEVALASVLLIGAGLMLRTFINLLRTGSGFHSEHILTATISLPSEEYKSGEAAARFYHQLTSNIGSLPDVQFAGAGTAVPWTGYNENLGGFLIEDRNPAANQPVTARFHAATPDYFRALGIPLLQGRFFTEHDNRTARRVLIIIQSMARRYWPNEDATGKRIAFTDTPDPDDWTTIVGIVGDVKDTPSNRAAEPAFWWPLLQHVPSRSMSIVVRAHSGPALLLKAVRREVHRLNPTLAVAQVRLMDQIVDASVSAPRFTLFLVGLFAALALALSAIGMYGVVSYSVNRRTHEFGLRMALGAKPWDVLRLVLVHGVKLSFAGVSLGVLCALALARALRGLLYEVRVADPLTFLGVSLLAVSVAMLACYIPARRATQAEAMSALGAE